MIVLPYDQHWEQEFLTIKDELQDAIGPLALVIEHRTTENRVFPYRTRENTDSSDY